MGDKFLIPFFTMLLEMGANLLNLGERIFLADICTMGSQCILLSILYFRRIVKSTRNLSKSFAQQSKAPTCVLDSPTSPLLVKTCSRQGLPSVLQRSPSRRYVIPPSTRRVFTMLWAPRVTVLFNGVSHQWYHQKKVHQVDQRVWGSLKCGK